jgi:predicted ATPase
LCWQGKFVPARAHLEQGLAFYSPQQHGPQAFLYGLDPGAICLSYSAWVLWHLGYPDQAFQKINEAFIFTQQLSHPFSLVFVLICACFLHQLRREVQLARERADAVIAQGGEQGFPQFFAWGTVWRGWSLAHQGQGDEGIAQIHQGIAAYLATGGGATWPYCLALLAGAYGQVDQAEEGLSVLTEALTIVDKTGEGFYEAEVYRLKGELLLLQDESSAAEAEGCFQRAIEIARQQSTKSLELRATMSLARLLAKEGRREQARMMLAEIYNWFTEGFDTADLKDAKALLDELAT